MTDFYEEDYSEIDNNNEQDRLFQQYRQECDDIINDTNRFQELFTDYPIKDKMFLDINYHASSCPTVNLHICPYQLRKGTNGKGFVQYCLQLRKCSLDNNDNNDDSLLSFYSETYLNLNPGAYNFMNEINLHMTKIVLHYGTFSDGWKYTGFLKSGQDFYVFVDLNNCWVNHHFLSMNDPFWMVSLDEIQNKKVCEYSISYDVLNVFYTNRYLYDVYGFGNKKIDYKTMTVYSFEERRSMDFTMVFGRERCEHPLLGECFTYWKDVSSLFVENLMTSSSHSKYVLMKHLIMYDSVETLETCDETSIQSRKNTLFVSENDGKVHILEHGNQTPLMSHNIVF